ncbi:hypothetical protein NDU88_009168 [Pleurodeles waltl]|uniref:Uncharacterized protein n=1 Tax=Pleurodeles waltl TaxID=8319 RepID=A0AAV7RUH9_PLEWA|nr:hypothetical protein NDU88_009168 [Pleurodeles waltl]
MALVGRPCFSECLPRWTGLSLVSAGAKVPSAAQGMRGTRGGSAHQPPQGEGAQDPLSSAAPGPGPQSLPEPTPGARLSRSAHPRAQRSSAPLGPVADATHQWPAAPGPAPPVPRSEHRTWLQQPQAPATARLPVPRGRLEPRRLRSSLASGPDPLQGTFLRPISSDFSASGPAALQDPEGVSKVSPTGAAWLGLPSG